MLEQNNLRLRPFRRGDAKEIITWIDEEEAFYKWTAGIMGEFPLTEERLLDVLSGRDDNDRYFPFTAVDNGKPIGFMIIRQPGEDPDELRFGFIIVDARVRGKGYGKKMLQKAIAYATEIYGAKSVSLGVFANNPGAHYCYLAAGLRDTGEEEIYELNGENWKCIEMEYRC